jgi:hypothetical protein
MKKRKINIVEEIVLIIMAEVARVLEERKMDKKEIIDIMEEVQLGMLREINMRRAEFENDKTKN